MSKVCEEIDRVASGGLTHVQASQVEMTSFPVDLSFLDCKGKAYDGSLIFN